MSKGSKKKYKQFEIDSYFIERLEGFIQHNIIRTNQVEAVLDEMKKDYQKIVEKLPDNGYIITGMGLGRKV